MAGLLDDYITYVFSWAALTDACPKCRDLHGRIWTDQDIMQPTLIDDQHGSVWNLDGDYSMAHTHCRCTLSVEVIVDITKLPEYQEFQMLVGKCL